MNDPTLIGPCADYEHDLLDLHDGSVPPERGAAVQSHLGQCARCRAWLDEFAALEARLAAGLPRPALSPDFDARLAERLAGLGRTPVRTDLRAGIDREYATLLDALRRTARRRGVLNAIASAAVTLCLLAAVRGLLLQGALVLPVAGAGPARWLVLGAAGAVMAAAALAWSASRYGVGTLGLRR
jgi:anti-sigma factor RsiW